jgi:hypothetical protein
MASHGITDFVVQEQVGRGVEILIGGRRDETFGPLVAAGAGGILAEAVRDVALRLVPLALGEARAMLADGVRARLLAGPRGLPRDEADALPRAIVAVATLLAGAPRVLEVDLNPMIVWGGGAVAVDAAVILE